MHQACMGRVGRLPGNVRPVPVHAPQPGVSHRLDVPWRQRCDCKCQAAVPQRSAAQRAEAASKTASRDSDAVAAVEASVEAESNDRLQGLTDLYNQYFGKHWHALPARYKVIVALSLSFVICNMDKINMSVAIIPMSQEFGWSSSVAGLVQSSFFWGYLMVQLPGGYLANRFGGRNVLPAAVSTWSVATALVPPLATTVPSLCLSRALVGLGEGTAPSAVTDVIVKIVPAEERSRAVSFSFGGLHVGSVLGLIVAPALISQLGWEGVFYIFGAAGLAWAVWFQSVLNDPAEDMVALRPLLRADDAAGDGAAIPWRAFLRNGPVRALMVTHLCHNWCHYTMLAWLPSYFKDALSLDLSHAAAAALLPPIASIATSAVSCQVADHFIARGAPVASVRKVAQTLAFLGPTACLAGAWQSSGSYESVGFIAAALGLSTLSLSGLYCTHQDLSPKYAPALLGFTNTSGSVPGIVGVSAVGLLLDQTHSWPVALFAPAMFFFVLGAVVYARMDISPQTFPDDSPFEWEQRVWKKQP